MMDFWQYQQSLLREDRIGSKDEQFDRTILAVARQRQKYRVETAAPLRFVSEDKHKKAVAKRRKRKRGGPK